MSALGWIGRSFQIAFNGTPVAAVRTKRVAYSNTPIDITEGESNGWRRLAERGDVRSIDVTVEGVATAENWPLLLAQFESEEATQIEVWHPEGSVQFADAFLASLTKQGEHSGAVTFSATWQMSGEIGLYTTLPAPVLAGLIVDPGNQLTWTLGGEIPATAFVIYRKAPGGEFEYLTEVSGSTFTYTDYAIERATVYHYRVTARSLRESEPSNEVMLAPLEWGTPGVLRTFYHWQSSGDPNQPWTRPTDVNFGTLLMVGPGGRGASQSATAQRSAGGGGGGGQVRYVRKYAFPATGTVVVTQNTTTFDGLVANVGGSADDGTTTGGPGSGGVGQGAAYNIITETFTLIGPQTVDDGLATSGGLAGHHLFTGQRLAAGAGGGGGAGGSGGDGLVDVGLGHTKSGDGGIGVYHGRVVGDDLGDDGWFAGGGSGALSYGASEFGSVELGVGGKGGGGVGENAFTGESSAVAGMPNTGGGGGGGSTGDATRGDGGTGAVAMVYYDPAVYGIDWPYEAPPDPPLPPSTTILEVLDTPMFDGGATDDSAGLGLYIAAGSADTTWPGCEVEMSRDGGDTWSLVATITLPALIGETATTLADHPAAWPDLANTVRVTLANGARALDSTDLAGICNGLNGAIIGGEHVRFAGAAAAGGNSYDLTTLLRGRNGTEAVAHAIGERFLLLERARMVFLPLLESDLGEELQFRARTLASPSVTDPVTVESFSGATQLERAPLITEARRDGDDVIVRWLGVGRLDFGAFAQHGEFFDGYEVTIDDGAQPPLVIDTPDLEVVADAYGFGSPLTIQVRQRNTLTGLGPPAEVVIP
jgi:predicted secreted protein